MKPMHHFYLSKLMLAKPVYVSTRSPLTEQNIARQRKSNKKMYQGGHARQTCHHGWTAQIMFSSLSTATSHLPPPHFCMVPSEPTAHCPTIREYVAMMAVNIGHYSFVIAHCLLRPIRGMGEVI